MLVRDSRSLTRWLADGQVIAKTACRAYVAIHIENTGKKFVDSQKLAALESGGWTIERDFRTTAPDRESWKWTLISREIPEGPVKLPAPPSLNTNLIFLFQ